MGKDNYNSDSDGIVVYKLYTTGMDRVIYIIEKGRIAHMGNSTGNGRTERSKIHNLLDCFAQYHQTTVILFLLKIHKI